MTKLSETSAGDVFIGMVYGDPGTGKSEFLASVNTDRALFITDLNGIRTVKNQRVRKLYPNFDPFVEVIQPDSSVVNPQAFNKMKDALDYWFDKRKDDFDWILHDDMTSLRRNAMYEAVKINGATSKSQTGVRAKAMHEALLPTEADFGTEMNLVESYIKDLTAACRFYGKNLVVAAHEKQLIVKDRVTKEETLRGVAPLFTGRAAPKNITGDFDFVFRLTRVGKGTNVIVNFQCHPDDVVAAKDRDSVFQTFENNLTIQKVMSRIRPPTVEQES